MHLRLELFVDDVEASVRFYETVLGFPPPANHASGEYASMTNSGGVVLAIQSIDALPADHYFRAAGFGKPRGVGVEIVIETEDVDKAYEQAARVAGELGGAVEPIAARPWGKTDFRIIDPDGYYLRVTS
jgi:catechol 2,3-dioxygenase-like lactoylglutathione lyase family enzyme